MWARDSHAGVTLRLKISHESEANEEGHSNTREDCRDEDGVVAEVLV
jgi:hypothetical protein